MYWQMTTQTCHNLCMLRTYNANLFITLSCDLDVAVIHNILELQCYVHLKTRSPDKFLEKNCYHSKCYIKDLTLIKLGQNAYHDNI